jgi:hypothetical protein
VIVTALHPDELDGWRDTTLGGSRSSNTEGFRTPWNVNGDFVDRGSPVMPAVRRVAHAHGAADRLEAR